MARKESASHINTGIYKHAEKKSGKTPPKTHVSPHGKIGGSEEKGMLGSKEHEKHMKAHHAHMRKHLDHLDKVMGHHDGHHKKRGRPHKAK